MSKLQNERLARYVEAEKAVLMGQSYTIGNRTLTRADLSSIRHRQPGCQRGDAGRQRNARERAREAHCIFRLRRADHGKTK